MINLQGTPYLLSEEAAKQVVERLNSIERRMALLRGQGVLTERTLKDYYGEKRFEQVAESNALEGSTLSVGETELAVLKGITITGRDPAYARDAVTLDRALTRVSELARNREATTDIEQLREVHGLLLGDRPGSGVFRNEPVSIRGAKHRPPRTWEQVMSMMGDWQTWSFENKGLPGPIRATVLHAWLTHVHPFIDGNGRVSRAIGNLELIRSGYPPIIIKKTERARYIDALAESDDGGDIRSFMELIFDRVDGGLTGIERSATLKQGFNPVLEKVRNIQRNQLRIWETGVALLASIIEARVSKSLESTDGNVTMRLYDSPLGLEEYLDVCNGQSVPMSWAFSLAVTIPAIPRFEWLAYVGHRSSQMFQALDRSGGPSIFWSSANPVGFPKWLKADNNSAPYAVEITQKAGDGDQWFARLPSGTISTLPTTHLANSIADAMVARSLGLKGV